MSKAHAARLGDSGDRQQHPRQQRRGRITRLDRWLVRQLLAASGAPLEVALWNGEVVAALGATPAIARLYLHDRGALVRLMANPQVEFGELYTAGRLEVEGDLVGLLTHVYRARSQRVARLGALRQQLRRRRPNTEAVARENIHHHYDIGNAFYQLWLDREAMQYTCAYYPRPDMSLEAAQLAKMDHVCRKLELRPGQQVIEAGSGWGGFACFMAQRYGVRVRAFNTSREQVASSRQRALRLGLGADVEFVEDDYRNITGECDVFVSIGMLEHVGPDKYHELGQVIDRSLRRHGRGLIHTIGRNRPAPLNAWITKRIFPGAQPPTLRQMMAIFEPWSLSVLDVENLRLHYERTLEHWLERYEANVGAVRASFGDAFVRAWRLYLSGSIAGFRSGTLQLFQVVFARADDNQLQMSRAHLYGQPLGMAP